MNTHDIKLPPIPKPKNGGLFYEQVDLKAYACAAIEADRKRGGEPVGRFTGRFTGEVNGDALFVVKAYGAIPAPGAELYTAPQPAEPVKCIGCEGKPAQENNPCAVCGKEAEPVKVPSDEVDLEEVRRYLDDWGCLDHPGVRALLARYGSTTDEATNQQREIE